MDNYEKLVSFISSETGIPTQDINDKSSIEDDLGITGEEAISLILNISNKFNVKISSFSFEKYFHPEPSLFADYQKLKPLNISHLKSALLTGELNDQDIP